MFVDNEELQRQERKRRAEAVLALLGLTFFAGLALGYFWAWKALT